jgi:hypothetical protein
MLSLSLVPPNAYIVPRRPERALPSTTFSCNLIPYISDYFSYDTSHPNLPTTAHPLQPGPPDDPDWQHPSQDDEMNYPPITQPVVGPSRPQPPMVPDDESHNGPQRNDDRVSKQAHGATSGGSRGQKRYDNPPTYEVEDDDSETEDYDTAKRNCPKSGDFESVSHQGRDV